MKRILRISVAAVLGAFLIAIPMAQADDAPLPRGLMWNRSGLPAVFPLQVKTPLGGNYYLTLMDGVTGDVVLAAFVRGGEFFKVLVPRGTYHLRFATGDDWQGEGALFGPGPATQIIDHPTPLTFAIKGYGTKTGHVVTITPPPRGDVL